MEKKSHLPDHRVRVTQQLIQNAFIRLLKEKPLHSISVRELCSAAGINRSTFYNHYLDIPDLKEKMENELYEKFALAFHPAIDEGSFSAMITDIIYCLRENAEYYEFVLGEKGDKAFAGRLLKYAYDQYKHNYAHVFQDAREELIEYYYEFATSGCIRVLQKWFSEGMNLSVEELSSIVEGIMLGGLSFFKKETACH